MSSLTLPPAMKNKRIIPMDEPAGNEWAHRYKHLTEADRAAIRAYAQMNPAAKPGEIAKHLRLERKAVSNFFHSHVVKKEKKPQGPAPVKHEITIPKSRLAQKRPVNMPPTQRNGIMSMLRDGKQPEWIAARTERNIEDIYALAAELKRQL